MVTRENIQKNLPWIECAILSFPLILLFPLFMTILIPNVIFYSILKKYNLGKDDFLYSVGFTSSCYILLNMVFLAGMSFVTVFGDPAPSETLLLGRLGLPILSPFALASLFYLYAVLLKNDKKDIKRVSLYLAITTVLLFVFGIVACFEMIQLAFPLVCLLLLLFGLYVVYRFIHDMIYGKFWPGFRTLSWMPVLPSLVLFMISICLLMLEAFKYMV